MKTKKYLLLLTFIAVTVIFGCNKDELKDTYGLSRTTYYPDFTFNGDEVMLVEMGTAYTEPGVTATEAGADITVTTEVEGTYTGYSGSDVDVNTADQQIITYTAINSDDLPGIQTRTVYVFESGDLVSSIAGLYTATILRNGTVDPQYENLEYVMIWNTGGNNYAVSDAIGGYYDLGRGYGDTYRASGMTITANDIPTNDFTFGSPVGVGAFGGVLEMLSMSVDAGSNTVFFESEWSFGFNFEVTLTQIQI